MRALALIALGCAYAPPCPSGTAHVEGSCVRRPVRLVAPLSTSTVTSARPTLRWEGPAVRIEMCRDRACTDPILAFEVEGASGAPPTDLPAGVVFWRALASSSNIPSHTWQMTVRSSGVDASWGTTLDFNGDGFADVAVATIDWWGVEDPGRVHVYLGGPDGIDEVPTFSLTEPENRGFGWVASAGDVDGDGFGDLAVGSTIWSTVDARGHVLVYYGEEGGYPSRPDVIVPSDALDDGFGRVACAGDVDRDGYADLVVGASRTSLGDGYEGGRAYVYRGGADGVHAVPSVLERSGSRYFGIAVAGAGDVDGDGYDDVIVSSRSQDSQRGTIYLYAGGPAGTETEPSVSWSGSEASAGFGESMTLGDLDGDGLRELIAGAWNEVANGIRHTYVFRGSTLGMTASPEIVIDDADGDFAPPYAIADVNGDAIDDLVVGAPNDADYAGAARLYLGAPDRLESTREIPAPQPSQGDGFGGGFGTELAGVGDVDADGLSDVMIGAPGAGNTYGRDDGTGRAYLFLGQTNGLAGEPSLTLVGPDAPASRFGSHIAGF